MGDSEDFRKLMQVLKSTLFRTMENAIENSAKMYGKGFVGSPRSHLYILVLLILERK